MMSELLDRIESDLATERAALFAPSLVATTAPDQLGQNQPDLQRLAQTHHIGQQDARAQPGQGQLRRALLVGQRVEQEPVGQGQPSLGARQWGTSQHRLQE